MAIKKKKESTRKILLDIRGVLQWFFSINGVIVTLTILIFASLITFIIQDQVQRQRYLELLQLELNNNTISANLEIKSVVNKKYLFSHNPIAMEVYNAGLQQGYLLTIDPKVLSQLYSLYHAYFPGMNTLMNHDMDIINNYELDWEKCEDNDIANNIIEDQCAQEHEEYLAIQKQYSMYIAQDDVLIAKQISQVKFNPTEERLHPKTPIGFILRVLMGDQSLKVQR
jgi:hypothetical protein